MNTGNAGTNGPGTNNVNAADSTKPTGWNNALAMAKKKKPKNLAVEHPKRVLFCLDLNNPFRKLCIKFVEWK
jgi:hypothetical protein